MPLTSEPDDPTADNRATLSGLLTHRDLFLSLWSTPSLTLRAIRTDPFRFYVSGSVIPVEGQQVRPRSRGRTITSRVVRPRYRYDRRARDWLYCCLERPPNKKKKK